MNNSLFSVEDKVLILETINQINDQLHEVRQHDPVEDVMNSMKEIERCLNGMRENISKLHTKDHTKYFFVKELLGITRSNSSIEEKKRKYTADGIGSLVNDIDHTTFKKINTDRSIIQSQIEVILQKIVEMQEDRFRYFQIMKENLSAVSEKFDKLSLENTTALLRIDKLLDQIKGIINKDPNNPRPELVAKHYIEICSELRAIKVYLNDINIERNKLRLISLYYTGHKSELLKKRNRDILAIKKEEISANISTQISDINALLQHAKEEEKSHSNGHTEKIKKNLINLLNKDYTTWQDEEKVLIRTFLLFHRWNKNHIKKFFTPFSKKLHDLDGFLDLIKKIDYEPLNGYRKNRTLNRQLNIHREDINLQYILEELERFPLSSLGVSQSDIHSYSHSSDKNRAINNECMSKFNKLGKPKFRENIIDLVNKLKSWLSDLLQPEIRYYLLCSRKHIKDVNNRIFAESITDYNHPDMIRNEVIKKMISNKKIALSSKFRAIIEKIDHFFGDDEFIEYLTKENDESSKEADKFEIVSEEVLSMLEELKIIKYSILSQFLYSTSFTNTTDRLQIYGGAFGIWNQEARELVRLQDRRYTDSSYRPYRKKPNDSLSSNLSGKWYDLPERIIDGHKWMPNPYADTVNLMFFAERKQMLRPEFYQNFSSDFNILNEIEKKNKLLFSEDGEIGAFILLYRFMNLMLNTPLEPNEDVLTDELSNNIKGYYRRLQGTSSKKEINSFFLNSDKLQTLGDLIVACTQCHCSQSENLYPTKKRQRKRIRGELYKTDRNYHKAKGSSFRERSFT